MHVAEAANVHQDVEAEFLSAAVGARDLVEPAAMAQSQIDDLAALRVAHARDHFANLPIGVMRVLIEQRGGEFDVQRLVIQQVHQRRRLDRLVRQQLGGSRGQRPVAFRAS